MKRLKYDTEIASDIIFWFGTHKEVQQSSDKKGIPCDIDLVNATVQKHINLLLAGENVKLLSFGIDTGPRPGLAWFADGKLIDSLQLEDIDSVVSEINQIIYYISPKSSIIRIGRGPKTLSNRIVNNCLGQGFNVDIGDIFGDIFGFGGSGRRKGQTYQTNLTISFIDAASGIETNVPLRKEVVCEDCRGNGSEKGTAYHTCNICNGSGQTASNQGFFSFAQPCTACKGQGNVIDKQCKACRAQGSVIKNETIKVKVPAGVDNGTVIRLRGYGLSLIHI